MVARQPRRKEERAGDDLRARDRVQVSRALGKAPGVTESKFSTDSSIRVSGIPRSDA